MSVKDAVEIRDFYGKIIGWDYIPENMGGYDDFHMVITASENSVAGISHARGENADIPPLWLMYITVEDVDRCAHLCEELGGEIIVQPRFMGKDRFCVIRDLAGAMCAFYRPPV